MQVDDADIAAGCLGTETLMEFVEGRSAGEVRARIESHASQCRTCREILSSLVRGGTPSSVSDDDAHLDIGTTLGRYVIQRHLGEGGMGVVYAAHDPELAREVAIKILRGASNPALREQLRREAQAMAKLAHPNVIAVYDAGVVGERMFVAMELVEGDTLARWQVTPRSVESILSIYRAAGAGLSAAHDVGIVHRDFKPENVLIGRDGRARVGDFGLARAAVATAPDPVVERHRIIGTPSYMAPELYRGGTADARSDQFSFAVALHTAVYGERPFAGDTLAQLADNIRDGKLVAPSDGTRVPRRIRAAILRGLAGDPAKRFASMHDLLVAIAPTRSHVRWIVGSLALAAVAAIVTAVLASSSPAAEPCAGAGDGIVTSWNPQRRAVIEARFATAALPYATAAMTRLGNELDRYTASWRDATVEACRATRVTETQSEAVLDLRTACLETRRLDVEALVDALATADAGAIDTVIERAGTAVAGLARVDSCADVAALQQRVPPPADLATRTRLTELTRRFSRVKASYQTGQYVAAREPARALVADARALGYLPFTADAALLEATIDQQAGDAAAAHEALDAALWAAEAGRHDETAAQIWLRELLLVGYVDGDFAKATSMVPRATAAIARLGRSRPEMEANLEMALGAMDYAQGKFASAAEHEAAGLQLADRATGGNHLDLGKALENLGTTQAQRGDFDHALPLLGRARSIYEAALGLDHPIVANVLHNLGVAHLRHGDLDKAEAELRRAMTIRESLRPDLPSLAATLTALGAVTERKGHLDDAVTLQRRAVTIGERAWGPSGRDLVGLLLELGKTLAHAHDVTGAVAALTRAEAIAAASFGPKHPYTVVIVLARAEALAEGHDCRAAIPVFERAIAALVNIEAAHDELVMARADLASCRR